eukprot:7910525-Alexandrium_andersonii.AAC.1
MAATGPLLQRALSLRSTDDPILDPAPRPGPRRPYRRAHRGGHVPAPGARPRAARGPAARGCGGCRGRGSRP